MEKREEVYLAALAGLLHDVGKFAQRAGWQKGEHTEVGGEVVRQYVPPQWREKLYPVMGHHDKPLQGYETKVVALADRLSAGERADEKQEQPKQLLSIFCRLETDWETDSRKTAPKRLYLPLKPLSLDRSTLFPAEEIAESDVSQGYKDLWHDFERELQALQQAHTPTGDLGAYLEGVLLLMQRYIWCVPSAYYRSVPDVSLYDHSRMTAALTACLDGKPEAVLDQVLRAPEQSAEPTALLVGGDISGVQNFIYTISSQGAASGLRGRSFYLQLLTEVVARYVLRRLGLPVTNLIYQGGGAFYLLARAEDGDKLREIQQEVSRVLLAHHRGDLYLALANVPLAAADFYGGRISEKWEEATRALREVKQRRFAELGKDGLTALFVPQDHGGNEDKQCQVCGREHPGTCKEDEQDPDGVRKCPQCRSYEALGDALRRARYLWLAEQDWQIPDKPLDVTPGEWGEVLSTFGFRGGVAGDLRQVPDATLRVILALKDESLTGLRPDVHTSVGRRLLVNVTPTYEQEDAEWLAEQPAETRHRLEMDLPKRFGVAVKPFSLLEVQSEGIGRLGVLRMDLDDGGRLFSDGFVERNKAGAITQRIATLSRVAALSFSISLYFEGWVERIAEAMNEEARAECGDTLYSIYSGGDDLFFVGAWDRVVELARRIRADLTPFAADHPGVHVSGGLVLVGGKYPLSQAAQDADGAEKAAKARDGKDAFTFLGQTTPWQRFGLGEAAPGPMETVSALTRRLVSMVTPIEKGGEGAPQSLIRRLIQLQDLYEAAVRTRRSSGRDLNRSGQEQAYWGPWMWRGYYSLKRLIGKKEGDPWDSINQLAEGLKGDNFRAIEWIGLAARWAELWMRK